MAKPALRQLVQLRRQLSALEDEVRENRRLTGLASTAAIAELGTVPGSERMIKVGGEFWRVRHETTGVTVMPIAVDEDI